MPREKATEERALRLGQYRWVWLEQLWVSEAHPRLSIPSTISDEAVDGEPRMISVIRAYRDRLLGGHTMSPTEALRVRSYTARPGYYAIHDGALRYRALELAGREQALVVIENLSDDEIYREMLAASNRASLSKYELSRLIREAILREAITQAQAARELGCSRQYVGQLVTAAEVGESVSASSQLDNSLLADKVGQLHAIGRGAPREYWHDLAQAAVSKGWSTNQSLAWAWSASRAENEPTPEPPRSVEPLTQAGELLLLGDHKLLCSSSLERDNIECLLDGETPDAIYTDPPYGVDSITGSPSQWRGAAARYEPVEGDGDTKTAKGAFTLCSEIEARVQIWWGANHYSAVLPESRCWVVWYKRRGDDRNRLSDGELAWTNQDSRVRVYHHIWNGFCRDSEQGERRTHPNQKPVALAEWCFGEFGVGDLVLDLFGGSGSTLIACERSGRHARLLEVSRRCCDVICARYQRESGQMPVIEATGEARDYLSVETAA